MTVAGFTIPGGMLYVGPTSGANSDPSVIDPLLPVDRENADRLGASMPYWPSYSTIPSRCRAAFLQWLAGGRLDVSFEIGYVFLFFSGLERRVLRERGDCTPDEIQSILAEVERLRGVYLASRSFPQYATSFLEVVRGSLPAPRLYIAAAPVVQFGDAPLLLRAGLAHAAADQVPLPAEWALAWCLADRSSGLGAVSSDCPNELTLLFAVRYGRVFGEGLVVAAGAAKLSFPYRPASAAFTREVRLVTKLPDPFADPGLPPRLQDVATSCAVDLARFGRVRSRRDSPSLCDMALLPDELFHGHADARVDRLRAWLDDVVPPEAPVLVNAADLSAHWPDVNPERLTPKEATEIAQVLARLGVGIEPDRRFGGGAFAATDRIALFRLPDDPLPEPSDVYAPAAQMIRLAAAVACAGDEATRGDRERVEEIAASMEGLPASERRRLRAYAVRRFETKSPVGPIGRWARALAPDERERLGRFLVGAAASDGRPNPGKVAALVKIFGALGLDPASVYREAHARATGTVPADEPVIVRRAENPRTAGEYLISKGAPPSAPCLHIDAIVVARKHAEWAEVLAMLAPIFAHESVAAAASPSPEPPRSAVPSLDEKHAALLRRLAARGAWARADVDSLCDELGLLPDGALEVLNDAAFDHVGGPVVDGDDPLLIDQEAIRRWME